LESEVPLESQTSPTLQYHDLAPEQNNTLRLKRLKRGHVGNSHRGGGTGNGKCNGKYTTLKSLNCSIAALATKFDKFNLPNDSGEYESSKEEE
jgi:hypothetical protein